MLTLNVNGLNFPIKGHCLANWIKKEDLIICCLQETHLIDRNKHWLRVKGWKKIYQANGPPITGRSSSTHIKVDFKLTMVKRHKEEHFALKKKGNTSKGNDNYQHIGTQCQCTQFHQTY
jgi:exonuclease III